MSEFLWDPVERTVNGSLLRIVDPGPLRAPIISFVLRRSKDFDLPRFWQDHLQYFDQSRFTAQAVVKVSASLAQKMYDVSFPQLVAAVAQTPPDADGTVTITLGIESIGNAAAALCRFGAGLEVLEPPELRSELAALGRTLAGLYESPSSGPARPAADSAP